MKKILFTLLYFFILTLTNSALPVFADCEQHDFGSSQIQYYIYSDGRTWDFTASQNMTVTTIETLSRLAGSGTYTLTIEVLVNGNQKASWIQNVTTTYTNYTHSQNVSLGLTSGDTITYKISGGTLGTPGGAITGPNYVKLCGQTCEKPDITSFTATPGSIQSGQEATLNWSITGADSADIDQEIGSVDPTSGSKSVSPTSSTTYTLTAINTCGSSTDTASVQVTKASKSSLPAIYHLLLNKDPVLTYPMIYGASDTEPFIKRFSINTGLSESLNLNEIQNPYGICVDSTNKKIYWTDYGTDKILRSNFDGGQVEVIVSSDLVYPCGIVVDEVNSKLYWTDWGNNTIKKSNLDGSGIEILLNSSQISSPVGITIDVANGYFYFADESTLKIQRTDLDGNNLVDIATNLPSPHGIVYSPGQQKLFWTNWVESTGSVQSSNTDGSNLENIVTGLNLAMGITIDTSDNRIYYSHEGAIRTCNFDGSDDKLAFSTTHVSFIVYVQN